MRKILIMVSILALSLTACDNNTSGFNKQVDKVGQELMVTVKTVKTVHDMKSEVWKFEKGIQGQALYSLDDNKCEIIIYEPIKVDDEATLTLGHELMHCLYGDYHE